MKAWQLDILISSDGFKGIQIIDADPTIVREGLMVIPSLRRILLELDQVLKSAGEEYDGQVS
jgi:hypothetical protein